MISTKRGVAGHSVKTAPGALALALTDCPAKGIFAVMESFLLIRYQLYRMSKNVNGRSLFSRIGDILALAESTTNMNFVAFGKLVQIGCARTLPGGNGMPRSFDHDISFTVLKGVIRRHRETGDIVIRDLVNLD